MYKKILYPTDFSETAESTLNHVKAFKNLGGEVVILLHIVDERDVKKNDIFSLLLGVAGLNKSVEEFENELKKKLTEEAKSKMEKIKRELEGVGFKVKDMVIVGKPHEKIVKVAEEEDVDVIIIGKTNLKEILGKITENVIKKSDKPVLIVKGEGY
ncbi:universal stress protein [Methanocaldococcus fervens]|uniref:universal stress protein n=1 Tax=Methanocaldococcus fervens TaxID=83171 RepID=UPI000AD2D0D8|nr:universal stress protein [Methanocaldococcus fervens]